MDTAGPVIGVGLVAAGQSTVRTERVRRGAEARLIPWARELCADAGLGLADLDGVAVARGPGAFTGVRVGLAAATGLSSALGLPVWPSDSLTPRAVAVVGAPQVLAMLDARKGRVYAALYKDGSCVSGPADVDPEVALGWVQGSFVATGEGALVYREQVLLAGGLVHSTADAPGVDVLARMGAQALAMGQGVAAGEVRPLYIRPPDAKPPKTL